MISLISFIVIAVVTFILIDYFINDKHITLASFDIGVGLALGFCFWSLICLIFAPSYNPYEKDGSMVLTETEYQLVENVFNDNEYYIAHNYEPNYLRYQFNYIDESNHLEEDDVLVNYARIHYIDEDSQPHVVVKEYDYGTPFMRKFFVNNLKDTYDFYIPEGTILTYEQQFVN